MAPKTKNPTAKRQPVRARPEPVKPPSDLVPNSKALAKVLGIAESTLKAWKRLDGCPSADGGGRYRVSEWKEWAKSQNRGPQEPTVGAFSKADWEIERLKRVVEGMDITLKERRKELIPIETLRAWFIPVLLDVRNELLTIPGKLAAQVPGMEPPAAEEAMRNAINEALRHISSHPWQDEPDTKTGQPVPSTPQPAQAVAVG